LVIYSKPLIDILCHQILVFYQHVKPGRHVKKSGSFGSKSKTPPCSCSQTTTFCWMKLFLPRIPWYGKIVDNFSNYPSKIIECLYRQYRKSAWQPILDRIHKLNGYFVFWKQKQFFTKSWSPPGLWCALPKTNTFFLSPLTFIFLWNGKVLIRIISRHLTSDKNPIFVNNIGTLKRKILYYFQ